MEDEWRYQGLILADAVKAAVGPAAAAEDIESIQLYIDQLSETIRGEIEVNVILLRDDKSDIVASNISQNIRETSHSEHEFFMAALNSRDPLVFVEGEPQFREEGKLKDMGTPEEWVPTLGEEYSATFAFPVEDDFVTVMTSIGVDGQNIGAVHMVLPLYGYSDDREELLWGIWVSAVLEVLLIIGGLVLLLNRQIFGPIRSMAVKMNIISGGDLTQRIRYRGPANEMGELANTFDGMIDRLQAAFDREKRFTADVAHELRTPLTALKGRIEVALTQPRTQGEYEDTLQELQKEVDRLTRLSEDLLFLTRLGQGRLQPQFGEVDLSSLLEAIGEQMRPLARLKDIELVETITADMNIKGDPDYLIRVFLNLVDNAIKYSPSGGRVLLHAEMKDGHIYVSINDTGPGISAEHIPSLFDRFYRVESDRSRTQGGIGLGLSIAYELTRAHGGNIEVQSETGKGATFTVKLPINPGDSS